MTNNKRGWIAPLAVLWLVFLYLGASEQSLAQEEEFLEPEKAFTFSASVKDAKTLVARWKIADHYYMYRDKVRFSTDTPGVTLGEPVFPEAVIKDDEFFGKVAIYKRDLRVEIPIERTPDAPQTVNLSARSQGCAEAGLCYPPITQTAALNLPAAVASGPLAQLSQLSQDLGVAPQEEEFLDPDQAFAFSAEVAGTDQIMVRWSIADGYYLYRDKIKLALADARGVALGPFELPPGELKDDEFFGRIQVYHHVLEFPLPLTRETAEPTDVTLQAQYQGCAEAGLCYPPQTKKLALALPAGGAGPEVAAAEPEPAPDQAAEVVSEQDRIAASLASGSAWLTIVSFFGFGLLLAFTPCVFPMIPILSSIIVGQGENLTTRKAFSLSLVYVLAMALTYTVAGVIAGVFGENLQAAFQNPWILTAFATVFVLLSLSMFGFYELQMPAGVQSKLTEISNRQEGGTLIGVAIMGFLSALIVGPCVAAPLAGALIYIGQTGDALLGGIALFALSMGMGVPLLAIGTSAGKLLPRAGGWMDAVKAVFGVLLLAVAVWMLDRILPGQITMLLWAALLIIPAIYMGALTGLGPDATGWRKFWKGVSILMLLYGALLVIGASGGNTDPFQPLRGVGGGAPHVAQAEHLPFKRIKSVEDLEREVRAASAQGKPVMLDFYADWCVACKEFEKYTFSAPGVQQSLSGAVLLQADVTDNDDIDQTLLKHFQLIGPPTILFFGPDGQERRNYRVVGFMEADQFEAHVERALQ